MLERSQWWLVDSSKPRYHICNIFSLFIPYVLCQISQSAFWLFILDVLRAKKHEISSKKCQSIDVGGFYGTQEIFLRVHKYSFILFNRQRTAANMIYDYMQSSRAANYWKSGFPSNDLGKHSTDFNANQIHKSYFAHRWKNLDFLFILLKSYSPNKVKKAHYIMTYSVASFYTQHPEM